MLEIKQRDSFSLGSVKRVIGYNTDDLYYQLKDKSILEFLDYLERKNVTGGYSIQSLSVIPGTTI